MIIRMSLTTEAIEAVRSGKSTPTRLAEIYHRVIGHFYQRDIDSEAWMNLMFAHNCDYSSWSIPAIDTILASIVNNPSIHKTINITVNELP
jgi:hypothetical protein